MDNIAYLHLALQSNQVLVRYQLRCLKQGDIPHEEYVIKAWLVDTRSYDAAVKDDTLTGALPLWP